MKRKVLWIAAVLILAAALTVIGILLFAGKHRIKVISGEQYVDTCPKFAKPGETVTVTTVSVSDGEVYVNGVDGVFVRPGVFEFQMPDADVVLKVTVTAFSDGA
jgi:hypothetical protein